MRDPESVMYAVEKRYSNQQFISYIEEKEEFPEIKTSIKVSVNAPQLSRYDELIRSC